MMRGKLDIFRLSLAASCSLLVFCASASALDPRRAVTQYSRRVWNNQNGLAQNDIHAVAQTADGYLWFGTNGGAVRFDGVRFRVFHKGDTAELRNNTVMALCAARDGSLWVGTEGGGLSRYKDDLWTNYTTRDGLAHNSVRTLYEAGDGSLWVGTYGGLTRIRNGEFASYTTRDGLPSDYVGPVVEDRRGALWVGTAGGLCRFDGEGFSVLTTRDGLSNNRIRSLLAGRDGSLWVGTWGGGLDRLKDDRWTNYSTRDGLADDVIYALAEDRDGSLWIGTLSGGLDRLRDGVIEHFTTRHGLTSDFVPSLLEDREGTLWVGTSDGVTCLSAGKFVTLTTRENLPNDNVKSVIEDRRGDIWIATLGGGLSRLRGGSLTTFTTRDGLPNDKVRTLLEDRDGALWVGTEGGGLARFDGVRFTRFTAADGLSNNYIRVIYEDAADNFWIGTDGGLNLLRGNRFTVYLPAEGLSDPSVRAIRRDRRGALWVGTDNGLDRFDVSAGTLRKTETLLPGTKVWALYEDAAGVLWIGTSGDGLARLEEDRLSRFTTRQGLPGDDVYGLIEDEAGYLWMSGSTGSFRARKSDLNAVADGRAASVAGDSYDTADGLNTNQFTGGVQPAAFRTRAGALLFPSVKGAVIVEPQNLRRNESPPPVLVEEVYYDKRLIPSLSSADAPRLPPGGNDLEVRYTALSFVSPERIRFRYKLEGFDLDWIEAGARRVAYYTNLPPGAYRFRVLAANNDGVWNETGAWVNFSIAPRFYQTTTFALLCLAAAALLAWALYRWRVNRMHAEFAAVLGERNRIAQEMHDTVIQGCVGISTLLEATSKTITAQPPKAVRYLDTAREQMRQTIDDARRAIRNLRSQALEQSDLAAALDASARRLGTDASLRVEFTTSGTPRRLNPICEHQLLRIGQEALANAAKHAAANGVRAELHFDDGQIILRVTDDGRGFEIENGSRATAENHFGLLGMRERAAQIGAQFSIHSAPGHGTEVTVVMPGDGCADGVHHA